MPPPKERYPGQFQNYRDNPSMGDYERMLGHSSLNVTDYQEWKRATQAGVLSPEERARDAARPRTMAEKLAGPPIAYLCTPGLPGMGPPSPGLAWPRVGPPEHPPSPPSPPGGEGPGVRGTPVHGENIARRKPRCTKKEVRRRLELIHDWLIQGASKQQIIRTAMHAFGIGRRMAQLYLQRTIKTFADDASNLDYLAEMMRSKEQLDRLYQIACKHLDKIEDPTKAASLLRAATAILKQSGQALEEIRFHRRKTRRDHSPDSRAATLERADMVCMPLDEFLERQEHARNRWFHEWNLCRLAEKRLEGTLQPGSAESPYRAAEGLGEMPKDEVARWQQARGCVDKDLRHHLDEQDATADPTPDGGAQS